jgi:putative FmdB family regulatory protein
MPMYEYRCEACGQLFEELRRLQDADAEAACPKCESTRAPRVMSATNHVSSGAPAGGCPMRSGAVAGCSPRGGFT